MQAEKETIELTIDDVLTETTAPVATPILDEIKEAYRVPDFILNNRNKFFRAELSGIECDVIRLVDKDFDTDDGYEDYLNVDTVSMLSKYTRNRDRPPLIVGLYQGMLFEMRLAGCGNVILGKPYTGAMNDTR